jgi:hypothetical protein
VAITCDACLTRYSEEIELKEFHFFTRRGGYGSIFGDGTYVSCEICQSCQKDFFGRFLKATPS